MSIVDRAEVRQLIELARWEDFGSGDVTSDLLAEPRCPATFHLLAKEPGVMAGQAVAQAVLQAFDAKLEITWSPEIRDGKAFPRSLEALATVRGPLAALLAAERVLLNFLQRMCGVATMTRDFVEAVAGTQAVICDTRKTVPGWRVLDKHAVACGGGVNHREGLFDAVLVKDNHLAGVSTARLAHTIFQMLNQLGERRERLQFVAVEAQDTAQVEELLKVVGVNIILLDNFRLEGIRRAVELRDGHGLRGKVALEVSGGVRRDTVRAIAETGVERISVGAITHSVTAVDLCLERI